VNSQEKPKMWGKYKKTFHKKDFSKIDEEVRTFQRLKSK
jgi:hypothetical protein